MSTSVRVERSSSRSRSLEPTRRADLRSGLYVGRVAHTRHAPKRHHLRYGVYFVLIDLDELPALDAIPGFGVDRWAPLAFHQADYGPRDGRPLRPWIDARLAEAGIDLEGGRVQLLCFPRVLGYGFNPIVEWFCYHRDGGLRAVVHEVSNTFGEWHHYLVPVDPAEGSVHRHRFTKELFVSPFVGMGATYSFEVREPDDRAWIVTRETERGKLVLTASFTGRRRSLDGRGIAFSILRYPLLTAKVIGGIHWHALLLWWKGAPYRRRGAPPADLVTIVREARGSTGVER